MIGKCPKCGAHGPHAFPEYHIPVYSYESLKDFLEADTNAVIREIKVIDGNLCRRCNEFVLEVKNGYAIMAPMGLFMGRIYEVH